MSGVNIQAMLAAAKAKKDAEVNPAPSETKLGSTAPAGELTVKQPEQTAVTSTAPKINLAPQQSAAVVPKVGVNSFMESAKELAGMTTKAAPSTPEQQQQLVAMSHEQLRANIQKMQDALLRNDPLMPTYLVQIKRVLIENEQLVYELSEEDIGKIAQGMYKASDIVIATKAATSRAGKKNVTAADLL